MYEQPVLTFGLPTNSGVILRVRKLIYAGLVAVLATAGIAIAVGSATAHPASHAQALRPTPTSGGGGDAGPTSLE